MSDQDRSYIVLNLDVFVTNSTLGIIQLDDSYYNLQVDLKNNTNNGGYILQTALKPINAIFDIILFYKNLEEDGI